MCLISSKKLCLISFFEKYLSFLNVNSIIRLFITFSKKERLFITKHLSICQSYIKPKSPLLQKKKVPTILLLINNEIIKEEYIYIYIYTTI